MEAPGLSIVVILPPGESLKPSQTTEGAGARDRGDDRAAPPPALFEGGGTEGPPPGRGLQGLREA